MAETKKIEFNSSVKERKSVSIAMEVSVSSKIVDNELHLALLQIQKEARIDGFRQGKAPFNLIKEKFLQEAKNRAEENIIRGTIIDALEKEKFDLIELPIVDEFDYEIGTDMKYSFTAECHPVFEVKDYKNIPINKEIYKVTDASLAESIDAIRESNAKIVPSKSGVSDEKSFVSVDYDGFDEQDKPIAEITAKNQLLDLSAPNTLKEFKTALSGVKANDEKNIKISYPQDYPNKKIAGKTVNFKVKVVDIKEMELPNLDDDFAKDLGLSSLDELKNKVKESIETEEKRRQDIEVENKITQYLLEKNVFDLPESLIVKQQERLVNKMREYLQRQGVEMEHIEKEIELSKDKSRKEAENTVRISYILNAIYDNEKLEVTSEDMEEEKKKMKEANANRGEAVDKYFEEHNNDIRLSLKETKLFKFLIDNAQIKEILKDMPLKKEKK
ncbi:MAG: trigger factor [Elusimicrobiota bacterium]|jgi:trigger factor|nr:trigger factor [Elusimicrobiota bacterium]